MAKKRALISVSDKTGIVEFAKELIQHDFEIISTGEHIKYWLIMGTVIGISEITNFPKF